MHRELVRLLEGRQGGVHGQLASMSSCTGLPSVWHGMKLLLLLVVVPLVLLVVVLRWLQHEGLLLLVLLVLLVEVNSLTLAKGPRHT